MQKIFKILLPLLIIAGAVALFKYLKATKPQPPEAKITEQVWKVNVEVARPQTLAPGLVLYGRVETPSLFKAAAPVPSRVARVLVRDGQRVKIGQRLVTLDKRDFLPPLRQAQAAVAELKAQLRSEAIRYVADKAALKQEQRLLALAKTSIGRYQKLRKQRLTSAASVDQAEEVVVRQALALTSRHQAINDYSARRAVLQARLQSARAKLKEAALNDKRSRINAPYASVISTVSVTAGDQVNANTVLLSLYALSSLEVRAKISVPFQWELQQALAAGVDLLGSANPKGLAQRIVLRLERLAGEASTTGIDGLFRIKKGQSFLRPGQLLHFTLRRPVRFNVLAVPYSALYGGKRLYTLRNGRLHLHAVEVLGGGADIGLQDRLLVQAEGLVAGDQLVVTNLPNAINGLRAEAATSK